MSENRDFDSVFDDPAVEISGQGYARQPLVDRDPGDETVVDAADLVWTTPPLTWMMEVHADGRIVDLDEEDYS